MVKVKICGIRKLEDALVAIEAGADAIGFVFAESKRRISVNEAKSIAQKLPTDILKIGVFVNASREELETTTKEVGLDFVQLHGDENPTFVSELGMPSIKAFRINDSSNLDEIRKYNSSLFLLDSGTGKYRGGNGTSFDWNLIPEDSRLKESMILAGGLNVDNVQQAIKKIRPYMVDVSSGVETNGKKDPKKIKQFILNSKREEIQ